MEINLVRHHTTLDDREFVSNAIYPATESRVHEDIRQRSRPSVTQADVQRSGDMAEREVVSLSDQERTVYRVIDGKSGVVICQLPSEEVLRVAHEIGEESQDGSGNSGHARNVPGIDVCS